MQSRLIKNELMKSDEVPLSDASASERQQGDQASDSVYDFLYHDSRRIASFLAQFETYGVPQQVKASEAVAQIQTTKGGLGASLQLPLLAKGQANVDVTTTDEERDIAEKIYDPLWRNARALLDYLTERDMIQRDILSARIGRFVLATGSLLVLDAAMLKEAWGKSSIKRRLQHGIDQEKPEPNRNERKRREATGQKPVVNDDTQFLVDLLSLFPHSVQAHLVGQDYRVWCCLSADSLVGLSSDLMLKHGVSVPGQWHMLGVLDALPEPADPEAANLLEQDTAQKAETAGGILVAHLSPIARRLLGRPSSAYGITPLLVFREVSG